MKTFKLDNEPKITSGFQTPEGYFDALPDQVNRRLEENQTRVIPLFKQRKTWILAAAAVLIFTLSIPLWYYKNTATADIDKATLENYLANHAEISAEDIVELMNEDDIERIKIDLKIEDRELEETLTADNHIEDYILN